MRPLSIAAAACATLLACAPRDSGPATVRVFGLDPAGGEYGLYDARLEPLDDVTEMRGPVARLRVSATLVDHGDGRTLARGGTSPDCAFAAQGGALVPLDFDSLAMASAYQGLSRARAFFEELGAPPEALTRMDVLYAPRIELSVGFVPGFWEFTDNAAFVPDFDGFLLVPHVLLQGVPFFTNQGVLTHEYGHRIFHYLVLRAGALQEPAGVWFGGVNEGLSDLFGGTLTGDADYILPSVGDATLAREVLDRDMAVQRVITAADARPDEVHEAGAFVAALLWQHGTDVGDRGLVARTVLAAERALGGAIAAGALQGEFSPLDFLSRYADALPESALAPFCARLHERFALLEQQQPDKAAARCR